MPNDQQPEMTEEQSDVRSRWTSEDMKAALAVVWDNARRRVAGYAIVCLLLLAVVSGAQLALMERHQVVGQAEPQRTLIEFVFVLAATWLLSSPGLCVLVRGRGPVLIAALAMRLAAVWAGLSTGILALVMLVGDSWHGPRLDPLTRRLAPAPQPPPLAFLTPLAGLFVYALLMRLAKFADESGRASAGWSLHAATASDVTRMRSVLGAEVAGVSADGGGRLLARALEADGGEGALYVGLLAEQALLFVSTALDDAVVILRSTSAIWHLRPDGSAVLQREDGGCWLARLERDTPALLRAWAGLDTGCEVSVAAPALDPAVARSYEDISGPTISIRRADGRVAFAARRGSEWRVIDRGWASALYAEIAARPILFLPDGRGVAFAARRDAHKCTGPPAGWFVVAGGKEYGPALELGPITIDNRTAEPSLYCLVNPATGPTVGWRLACIPLGPAAPAVESDPRDRL